MALADGNNDQDYKQDGQGDEDQVAIRKTPRGKVGLRFVSPRGQLGDFLITKFRYGSFDLRRIHVNRLERLSCLGRSQELIDSLLVVLTCVGCGHSLFPHFGGADDVVLRAECWINGK
jgi:hypothetical protein